MARSVASASGGSTPEPSSMRSRRPTAADVARLAGVSRATVSYVMNNTPHQVIPESTRQRVLAAAAELDYTPSAVARALSSGRSEVVLLLLPDWPIGPSVGALLRELSIALAERGLTFLAHPLSGRPISQIWNAVTPATVLALEPLDEAESDRLRSAGIDLVVTLFAGRRRSAMDIPELDAGRLQAEHLVAAGHLRLGYAWPDDPRLQTFAGPRLEGLRAVCTERGLAEPQVLTVPLAAEGAAHAIRTWREPSAQVTGICAYNDDVGLALLAGARRLGLGIPEDLAVIGVDDIPAAALAEPALSTIRPDQAAIARYIAETVTRRLDGRPAPRRPTGDLHIVLARASTSARSDRPRPPRKGQSARTTAAT